MRSPMSAKIKKRSSLGALLSRVFMRSSMSAKIKKRPSLGALLNKKAPQ